MDSVTGLHSVITLLLKNPDRVKELLVAKRSSPDVERVLQIAGEQGIKVKTVSKTDLDHQYPDLNHQGVVAHCRPLAPLNESDLKRLIEQSTTPALVLILDCVQDPHNLGACLRTADGAGVTAVVVPKDRSAGLTATVTKVASGAAESVPLVQVTNLVRTMKSLQDQGLWLYGTSDQADKSFYEVDYTGPVGIVLGSEGDGLRRLTEETCDELLSLPMAGVASSLNVSVASGICLYEVVRQRCTKK